MCKETRIAFISSEKIADNKCMTLVAIAVSSVVCGWCILLVMSDERQRALAAAQMSAQLAQAAAQAAAEPAKPKTAGKRKN
jgi:hypothetical protein